MTKINIYHCLAILYGVGLAGHAIPVLLPVMLFLTPWFLLVVAAIIVMPEALKRNYRLVAWVGIVAIITWLIEAIGVATGKIFGSYEYGTVLGFHILSVPPVIGLNWAVVALGSISLGKILLAGKSYAVFLAPALVIFFDVFMEPVAVTLNYWHWFGPDIPLQNYIAWGAITLAAVFLWIAMKVKAEVKLPAYNLVIMFCYFLIQGFYLNGLSH